MGGTISYEKDPAETSGIGFGGYWSSTEYSDTEANGFGLWELVPNTLYVENDKREGQSIRCLKD
jgi:hypothetical protein